MSSPSGLRPPSAASGCQKHTPRPRHAGSYWRPLAAEGRHRPLLAAFRRPRRPSAASIFTRLRRPPIALIQRDAGRLRRPSTAFGGLQFSSTASGCFQRSLRQISSAPTAVRAAFVHFSDPQHNAVSGMVSGRLRRPKRAIARLLQRPRLLLAASRRLWHSS